MKMWKIDLFLRKMGHVLNSVVVVCRIQRRPAHDCAFHCMYVNTKNTPTHFAHDQPKSVATARLSAET